MINDSITNNKLPKSLYETNICILLKKGKEETETGSYRAIALLNFDQKSVMKVLDWGDVFQQLYTLIKQGLSRVDFRSVMCVDS